MQLFGTYKSYLVRRFCLMSLMMLQHAKDAVAAAAAATCATLAAVCSRSKYARDWL